MLVYVINLMNLLVPLQHSLQWHNQQIVVITIVVCYCTTVDAREAGEGKLDVAIIDPNGQPLTCDVACDSSGAYAVSYIPFMAGPHHVDIYFNGVNVAGKYKAVHCEKFKIILIAVNHNKNNFHKPLAHCWFY